MEPVLPVTIVFAAIFAIILFSTGTSVGSFCAETDIQSMDDGNDEMLMRMRTHGSYTECVSMALLALAYAGLFGALATVTPPKSPGLL